MNAERRWNVVATLEEGYVRVMFFIFSVVEKSPFFFLVVAPVLSGVAVVVGFWSWNIVMVFCGALYLAMYFFIGWLCRGLGRGLEKYYG